MVNVSVLVLLLGVVSVSCQAGYGQSNQASTNEKPYWWMGSGAFGSGGTSGHVTTITQNKPVEPAGSQNRPVTVVGGLTDNCCARLQQCLREVQQCGCGGTSQVSSTFVQTQPVASRPVNVQRPVQVVQPQRPVVQQQIPIVKPQKTVVQQQIQPLRPVVQQPIVQPPRPIVQQQTPIIQPQRPVAQQQTQFVQQQRPIVQQQVPAVQQQRPIIHRPIAPVQNNFVPQQPYVGPLAEDVPVFECAAALKCVDDDFCNAIGVMENQQLFLTPEQRASRVPLTRCYQPDVNNQVRATNPVGVCCRDPNYKDPWPANMPMPMQ